MNGIFLKIINMSISASWLVLAVVLLRFLLKKSPKGLRILLWAIVALRLICPFSLESALSLIPSAETIPMTIEMDASPAIDSGISAVNQAVNPVIAATFTPNPANSVNPLQIWITLGAALWVAGVAVMLIFTGISYWRLRRSVATAVRLRDNIFQSEYVGSPFVLGMIKPKIYLPFSMDGQTASHVIAHEQAHIRRRDHWWKPLGFLLLTLHWFNPLIWLAYILLCRDIELACDEQVIGALDNDLRADYSQALLSCSVSHRTIAACPLAFGEVGVKGRIRSVMNYRKPAFWITAVTVIACIAVAVCFLTDPVTDTSFDQADIVGSIDAELDLDNALTDNGDVLIIQNGGGFWELEKGQESEIYITFENETSLCSKTVGYIYCSDDGNWQYSKAIFSNQDLYAANGSFQAPETGKYLFYFRNMSSDWISLTGFDVKEYPCFYATVVDGYEGVLLVEPMEGSRELQSANRIEVPIRNIVPSPEPQPGDTVEIFYDGQIQETYPAKLETVYRIRLVDTRPNLSLNDVIILSQEGYHLTWSDFDRFRYTKTGSGLYIRVYEINNKFQLWIGGTDPDSEPMYIYLVLTDDIDIRTDIRDGGVTEFISEANVPEQKWDKIPTVMVDGEIYIDTGIESQRADRPEGFDGEITSSVSGSGTPYDNNQSNFGSGYGYQYGALTGTVELYLNGKWFIFAREDARQQVEGHNIGRYYLTVGAENAVHIEIEMPGFSGGCMNADGSPYRKGEQLLLELLNGCADLRGLKLTAYDGDEHILWAYSVPDTEDNAGLTHFSQNGWSVSFLQ